MNPPPLHNARPTPPTRRTVLQAGSLVLLLGTQQIARGAFFVKYVQKGLPGVQKFDLKLI